MNDYIVTVSHVDFVISILSYDPPVPEVFIVQGNKSVLPSCRKMLSHAGILILTLGEYSRNPYLTSLNVFNIIAFINSIF